MHITPWILRGVAVCTVLILASNASGQGRSVLGADVANYVTDTMDGYYAWYEQGFNPNAPSSGLPHSGVNNALTGSPGTGGPAGTFILQPYNTNNVLLLTANHRLGTLTFANPIPGNAYWLTTATGSGPAYINTVTHFSDGTPDFTQNVLFQADWVNHNPSVFTTTGRVDIHPFNFTNPDSVPGDFQAVGSLTINITTIVFPNPAVHPISSIDIDWFYGRTDPQFPSNTAIFGVSVSSNGPAGPFIAAPLAPSSFNQDVVVEASALAQPAPEPGLTAFLGSMLLLLKRRRPICNHPQSSAETLESRTLLSTTWTVTSTADDGSPATLRSIIAGAAAGDSVAFDSTVFSTPGAPHSITLNGTPIEIPRDINIQGPGSTVLTIDGNKTTRGFIIDSGAHLTLSGATVTQCNNTVDDFGGAVVVQVGGSLNLSQCVFSNNTSNLGGAIYSAGNCLISDSFFNMNFAYYTIPSLAPAQGGGAIQNMGSVAVTNTSFMFNTAFGGAGGAIENYGGPGSPASATLTDCSFSSNNALGSYGGGAVESGGTLQMSRCTFDSNHADTGGGVSVFGQSASIDSCMFTRNAVRVEAAGIYVSNASTVTVSNSTVDSGTSSNYYGGIENRGTLNLTACTVSNNSAQLGGGVGNRGGATLRLVNSTVSGNTAGNQQVGGGIFNEGSLFCTNSTIAANAASGSGGGIFNSGTLVCTNVTIAGNTTGYRNGTYTGGGIFTSGSATLNNTIVTNNFQSVGNFFDNITGTVTGSFNLVGPGGTNGLVNSVNYNIVGVGDLLSPLADFGGPTKTIALLPGSLSFNTGYVPLAVDQSGQPLTTDERGQPRVSSSSVDIGAYEANTPTALPSDLTATIGPDQINLSWSNNGSNGPFALYRGTSPGGEGAVPIASQITNSFVDFNVLRDVTYYYRVAAADAFGHGPTSNEISASAIPIGPISSPDGQASLTFIRDLDNLHINWNFGSNSGQFPASDPNFITVIGNPTNTAITLDTTNGDAMPQNIRLKGLFTFYMNFNTSFHAQNIDVDQSTVYFVFPPNIPPQASTIQQFLHEGFALGAWNGLPFSGSASITSSAITPDMIGKYSIGYADSADHVVAGQPANTIEVRFTVAGDANLDGITNYDDALILQKNFNLANSPAWDKGNFDYNSTIGVNDAILLARNYLTTTLPAPQTAIPAALPTAITPTPVTSTAAPTPSAPTPPTPASTPTSPVPPKSDSQDANTRIDDPREAHDNDDRNPRHKKPAKQKHRH